MHYFPFGSTGISVSQIALGTGLLGMNRADQIDRSEAEGTVNAYLEAGGNFIDTSDAYLGGKSEEMLGEFLRGRREDVALLTKYTRTPNEQRRQHVQGITVRQCCNQSTPV
jgi:aryl-alcohol dehydrogenase-like predicted oxidoreductase